MSETAKEQIPQNSIHFIQSIGQIRCIIDN